MAITENQVLTWLGVTTAPTRAVIRTDLLSDGLSGLEHMSEEEIKDACTSYAKRTDGPFPIIFTLLQRQRVNSLVLWVKDRVRAGQTPEFEDGTTRPMFITALNDSLMRNRRRKEQKKVGESFHDHVFNTKLKAQVQWEKFNDELESTLSMIIGVTGVPLSYVIREEAAPSFDPAVSYDTSVIQAVALTGDSFRLDARTVHQLILLNVHEDSDAYTYIKTLLRHHDGRRDILALRARYSNVATQQAVINGAISTLDNLRYKSERSFSFEKFSSKLQKAYDELSDNGREVNNGDIVDSLWPRIQCPEIQMYISSLKVDYQRNQRTYKLILQDIATEVASKRQVTFAPGTRATQISAIYTRTGPCPKNGVHTADGSVFIGSYAKDQWFAEAVKPHHQEIVSARTKDGGQNPGNNGTHNSRGQKRQASAVRRNKQKLKKLNVQIAAAKVKLSDANDDNDSTNNNAGNEFGGKRTKRS